MGTSITDWTAVEGAYYAGAGGGEWLWLFIAIALTVIPLFMGAKHELQAYEKIKK